VQRWRRRWAQGDFSLEDETGRGRKADFPPLDHALVKAIACALSAETPQPLRRQALADSTARAHHALGTSISRSTLWRMLDQYALKPWRGTSTGAFPAIPALPRRRARFWTSMEVSGKASALAPRTMSSVPTRRPAFRPASAVIPRCRLGRADRRFHT